MSSKEQTSKKRLKKIILRIAFVFAILFSLVIIFISPITKYLVQKYDTKFLGREITMEWAYVNPFTGYIHFDNLKIYEIKKDSVFFEASGLSANFAMSKLFYKTYEISSLKLSNPKGNLIRKNNVFNFNDIIQKFSDTTEKVIKKAPVHFNILNCEISNGEFYFSEPNTPVNYSFLKVNFKTDGKYWNQDTINGNLSLQSGIGSGDLKANFLINTKTLDYNFGAVINQFNLGVVNQYLKALASYGSIRGFVNANVKAKGNFKNSQNIDGNGRIAINDFHFGKDSTMDYVSYKKLTLGIIQLAPANKKYLFDTVKLDEAFFKFEKYDYLDNIQNLFGEKGSKVKAIKENPQKFNLVVTISKYVQNIFKNFFKSDYKINSFAVVDANLLFNDFSANEKFSASLNPLNIYSDFIDKKRNNVNVYLKSGIKPYGLISVTLNINPRYDNDFNLNYSLKKIPVPLFNPYTVTYTSFPLDRGTIELFGNWQVRNDMIQSKNHLIIIDPRVSKRIKKKGNRWIPLPLIMFFVKERGNVIDYEIPITGYLKDPKFHFKDAIFDAIKNILIKPVTTPYRFQVRNLETEIENSMSLVWYMRQTKLTKEQDKFLNRISDFLKDNPDANIVINPMTYEDKEKESILLFEAKKKYYLSNKGIKQIYMTEKDSLAIDKMPSKEPAFLKYLDNHINETLLFTVQEKCYRLLGNKFINTKFKQILSSRNKIVMDYFKEEGTYKQIKILNNLNTIPFNGFSVFKINYNGKIPESVKEAYEQLNDYNSKAPREKYRNYRKKRTL